MHREAFSRSLGSSPLCFSKVQLQQMSAANMFDVYDATLRRIADIHAPAST